MPEAVELLVRGRERAGAQWPRPTTAIPATEVEVLAPGVVPDAAALAAHDRDVRPRVGRQHRVSQR